MIQRRGFRSRARPSRRAAAWLGVGWLLCTGTLGPACHRGDGPLQRLGTVERTAIELTAPASETLVEVRVERGQHVEPGELLLRLDDTLAGAEVATREANLEAALAARVQAEHDFERLTKLQGQRVASEQELDRARRAREEAVAGVRAARARLAAARKRQRDLALSAPVAGIVDQIPFDAGERVPAGSVLAVLLADERPWVRLWVPEPYLAQVGPGSPATVRIDGIAGPLRGTVLDVAREPEFTPHYALTERDRGHLVYESRVEIEDAPPGLRPGLPAEVTFPDTGPAANGS